MLFRELNGGACKTYLVGCEETREAVLVDPVLERTAVYLGVLAYHGLRLVHAIDTHTHADHRSGCHELARLTDCAVVMHERAPAPGVDRHVRDGDRIAIGEIEAEVLCTPGHTPDSLSLRLPDRVLTGDVLLIRGTGRSDFMGGDAGAQYDAIHQKLFTLPDDTLVFPGHDYRGNTVSTIGEEKCENPRLAGKPREEYVEIMANLGLPVPSKIQEVLQPNQTALEDDRMHFPGIAELATVLQLAPDEVRSRIEGLHPPKVVDVREESEFSDELGHVPGSVCIPLGKLAERAPAELGDDLAAPVVLVCRAGVRSTTGAAILAGLGYVDVSNLKGGMLDWNEAGLPIEK